MRILVCAMEAPVPPLNGTRLQLNQVCSQLAIDHEVMVLAYRRPEQDQITATDFDLTALEPPATRSLTRAARALVDPRPVSVGQFEPKMLAAAREAISGRKFDALLVSGWSLAGLASQLAPLPAVLAALDAGHLNARAKTRAVALPWKPLYALEARNMERFERKCSRDFHSLAMVSDEDGDALRELDSGIRVVAVPNGVDSKLYRPNPEVEADPNLIVFTGAMQWPPNSLTAIYLAEEVFPRVRERHPAARLALVGRSPGSDVLRLERISGVEVTGSVPSILGWLHRGAVFACPMIAGTGIKNKLLEALSAGLPATGSTLACQGLSVEHDRELLIADDASTQADSIVELLNDRDKAERLASRGRDYVVERHGWSAVGERYEQLLQMAVDADRDSSSIARDAA